MFFTLWAGRTIHLLIKWRNVIGKKMLSCYIQETDKENHWLHLEILIHGLMSFHINEIVLYDFASHPDMWPGK